ncbi:unnamed protein product, partial [Rotaria magnacalcarata]
MAYNNDYEIEISDDSEATTTTTTTDVESSSFRDKLATNIKEKKSVHPSQKDVVSSTN